MINKYYIGADETGKGDIFGPMVVAGFYYTDEIESKLKHLTIRDSKVFSDSKIISLANSIQELISPNYYFVNVLTPSDYNEQYLKYKNQYKILAKMYITVLNSLSSQNNCNIAYIDNFPIKYLSKLKMDIKSFIKGDVLYKGISIASILAKNAQIKWFDEIEKETGIKFSRGSSKDATMFLKNFIKQELRLTKFLKLHFKPVSECLQTSF